MKIDPCSKGSWWQECVTGISEGPRLRTKMLGLLVQVLVWFDVAMWASSPVSWVTNVSGNKNSPFLGSDEIDNVVMYSFQDGLQSLRLDISSSVAVSSLSKLVALA
ncbi:hypothetical protein SCA6_017799 [Theobroma cacao]